jgi:choice-of-anchor A domain-containing protein
MRSLSLAIGTALTLVTGLAAVAAPTTAVILADYNAVIFGGGSTTADIEGAAIIGGNFSGATVYNNPGTNSSNPVLTVFGDTSGNPINLNNGGSAFVGGKKGAIINFNGGGKYVSTGAGGGISEFRTPLTQLSTSLSLLNATSVLPPAGNNEVIKATPGKDGIAVFNVTAADLAAIPSYKIDMNGAKSVFFNVTGASVTFNANNESGTTGANNIIWNFVDATSVDFKTLIAGTVLAPDAHVSVRQPDRRQPDCGKLVRYRRVAQLGLRRLFADGYGGSRTVHDRYAGRWLLWLGAVPSPPGDGASLTAGGQGKIPCPSRFNVSGSLSRS